MNRLIIQICLIILTGSSSLAQRVTVGVWDFYPLMFENEHGQMDGLFINVLEHVAEKEGWELVYERGTNEECRRWVEQGKIDMLGQAGNSKLNQEKYILSEQGVLSTWARIYAHSDAELTSLLDLAGKKVAILPQSYFVIGPNKGFLHLLSQLDISCQLIEVDHYEKIFALIEEGEVDAGLVSRIYGDLNEDRFSVQPTPIVFSPFKMSYAFSKKSSQAGQLRAAIDREIKLLKQDNNSFYYQLLDTYFQKNTPVIVPLWVWGVIIAFGLGIVQLLVHVLVLRKQVEKRTEGLKEALNEIKEREHLLSLIYNNTRDFIGLLEVQGEDFFIIKKLPGWFLDKIAKHDAQYSAYRLLGMELSVFYNDVLKFDPVETKTRHEQIKEAIASSKPVHFEEKISTAIGIEGVAKSVLIPIRFSGKTSHVLYVSRDVTEERAWRMAITQSEERMRLAVQNVPVMLDAFDHGGKLLVWNKRCEEVTGYTSEEMIGNEKSFELLYPDTEYRLKMQKRWAQHGNDITDETVITCKDGGKRTILWIHQSATYPIPGWADWGIGIDVTEQRAAKLALEKSEQQLSSMMSNLPGMAWRLKIDENFTMIFVSEGSVELLGLTPSEFLSKGYKPRDFILEEYHELVRTETYRSVKEMSAGELVIPLHVNGKIKWVLDRFKPVKLADGEIVLDGMLIDISDKLESEQQLQMAIEGAREGMWDWNIEEDVLELNQYAIEMLGINDKRIEVASERFFAQLHPDDREVTQKALDDHLEGKTDYYEREYRLKTLDKGWKWIQTRGRVVQRSAEGKPVRAIGTHIDINDRKVAEFALVEKERLLSSMMFNLPGMSYRLDPRAGYSIEFVSEGCKDLFEVSNDEFTRRHAVIWDCIAPEYHGQVRMNYEEHTQDGSGGEHIIPIITDSGKTKWVLDRFNIVQFEDGLCMLDGIMLDITEKLENEQRLQLAIEGTRQGMWDWNAETGELTYNDYMMEMLGYEKEEMGFTAESFFNLLHPDQQEETWNKFKDHLKDKTTFFEQEYRIRVKSGEYKWVMNRSRVVDRDQDGRARRVLGVHIDIDARKKAEIALSENERMLSALMSNLPGMVYRCHNDRHWTMVFVSEGAKELTGYPADELESNTTKYGDIILGSDKESVWKEVQTAVLQGRPFTLIYRIRTKEQKIKWVWEQGGLIEGTDLLEGFMTDITDRVEAEEKIVSTVIETEDNERKRIAKELHDSLGQKLTTASLNFNSLKKDMEIDQKGFSKLITGLNSLNAAIKDSRDIAHNLMPRSIENFGFVPSVESMIAEIDSVSDIKFEFYDNLEGDRFDEKLEVNLYRIVQEAVNNILKYSQAKNVTIQLMRYEEDLVLTVEDDGIGFIVEEVLAGNNCFGLKSMRNRVNSLSGNFNLDSFPNRGTSITIELPHKKMEPA